MFDIGRPIPLMPRKRGIKRRWNMEKRLARTQQGNRNRLCLSWHVRAVERDLGPYGPMAVENLTEAGWKHYATQNVQVNANPYLVV